MRSSSEALKVALSNINLAMQDGNYFSAIRLAANLIKLSYNLESKTELFLGEMLESVFIQIHHELKMHKIPDADVNALNEKMNLHMTNLMAAYDTQNGLFDVLIDMRNDATVFQFTVSTQYEVRIPDTLLGDMDEE